VGFWVVGVWVWGMWACGEMDLFGGGLWAVFIMRVEELGNQGV